MSQDEVPTKRRLAHSFESAAEASGVGRSSLYKYAKAGQLKVRKAGRRSIILDDDLREMLANLPRWEVKC
ncbi:helix-turn-helix domain-containing protein [Nordella sp. HKS 07]|uniref:helix-turn-helix domain-containing protein n=1 Tax=Nordella sp. HKS 07 TaxID=2712222 RepID=UPI0013E185EF|nr:helix-turn-helix domain-containing protein [Nordella sp. HKS 07]QIG46813.1 helix-turn-helix domain-containing protein [Nordella sp. HKS 07]